jgi:hypothetical protein
MNTKQSLRLIDIAIVFAVAFIILIWNLKNSFEYGRLAYVPAYDDISYFRDSVVRYHRFLSGNIHTLVRDFFANPPHSPIITMQAVVSYIIFGVQDWAPYVTCLWIPLFTLLCALAYSHDTGKLCWVLLLYIATLPMMGAAVVEFRPDIGNGILTASCVAYAVYALTEQKSHIRTRKTLFAGALFGLALLSKPSAFPYTIGMVGLSLLTALMGLLLTRSIPLMGGVKRAILIVLLGLGLAGPYYFVAGREILDYTWNALVRDRSLWEVHFTLSEHLRFYLDGSGGRYMLGLHRYVSLLSILLLFYYRDRFSVIQRLRFYAIFITTIGGYLVITANPVKTHFLGAPFQSLLILSSFLVYVELFRKLSRDIHRLSLAGLIIIISLLSIQPTEFWNWRIQPPQAIRRTAEGVIEVLRQEALNGGQTKTAFIMFTGFVNVDFLEYELLKSRVDNLRVFSWHFRPAEEEPTVVYGRGIAASDLVIAATENSQIGKTSNMPSNKILPLTLSLIQNNPDFYHLTSIPSGIGEVEIYSRKKIRNK